VTEVPKLPFILSGGLGMGLLFPIFASMKTFQEIVQQTEFSREDLTTLLLAEGEERQLLLQRAQSVKLQTIGNKVFFRGLVEFSNICAKDCLYCGIRKSNDHVVRYEASDEEILDACRFAWENRFGSVVLQSGEFLWNESADCCRRLKSYRTESWASRFRAESKTWKPIGNGLPAGRTVICCVSKAPILICTENFILKMIFTVTSAGCRR